MTTTPADEEIDTIAREISDVLRAAGRQKADGISPPGEALISCREYVARHIRRLLDARDREIAELHKNVVTLSCALVTSVKARDGVSAERDELKQKLDALVCWNCEIIAAERDEAAAALAAMREAAEAVRRGTMCLAPESGECSTSTTALRHLHEVAQNLPTRARALLAVVEAARQVRDESKHQAPYAGVAKLDRALTALDAPKER